MEANPKTLPTQTVYKLMSGSILPRPIGWISTMDSQGNHNLAPFSFFNAICPDPPHLLFCTSYREGGSPKDTLANVRETGEFVVNIVTETFGEAMNITATDFLSSIDEFDAAGLTMTPAMAVRPARVADSPIHFECKVTQIVELGDHNGGGAVVIGEIVHIHVDETVLWAGDKIDLEKLQPVGRLSGSSYCRVTDIYDMVRPRIA